MHDTDIVIKGAREHNLRSVALTLPKNRLICFSGVSGSGKSSLAFDTLYAEGQRRYIESLSTYAQQFLGQMPKPDVDLISGLSPSISISQKSTGSNPRSTVGTITEIYDYLRVLYARVGQGFCPECGEPITAQSREQIIDRIATLESGAKMLVLAPVVRGQKGEFRELFASLRKQGFIRARVDGELIRLDEEQHLERTHRHNVEVVIDRLTVGTTTRTRLAEAVDLALTVGDGHLAIQTEQTHQAKQGADAGSDDLMQLSAHYACVSCGLSFEPPSPQLFSFNSPRGMCPTCDGLGEIYGFDLDVLIPDRGLTFKQGCIELLGSWQDLGRWRRHIYKGVADTLERTGKLEKGIILDTPWKDLDESIRRSLLWGTGTLHITYTWRGGSRGHKYGGTFDGIIPELMEKYRTTQSRIQRRQLEKYMQVVRCEQCEGQRLNARARAVRLASTADEFATRGRLSLPDACGLSVSEAATFFAALDLSELDLRVAGELLKEIRARLGFLLDVGLNYLSLDRTAPTLSGGEAQRIRLASQIGSGLVGVLYILDEPSIGLHARDNDRLLATLRRLTDLGNTVVVVEHDEETIRAADLVIDFGPGPGVRGGEVVAIGSADDLARTPGSITGQFLSGERKIAVPDERRTVKQTDDGKDQRLTVRGATHNNLKNVDVQLPLGMFVCVTGVSGSGKSSLVNGIIVEALRRDLNGGLGTPGGHDRIDGLDHLDKLIAIDQSPIGRTPRSNPATYIKLLDDIRALFAQLPEAKARGYKPGRFSFNVSGGRCDACEGNGSNRLEMDFLADIWTTCPVCEGHRFNRETLEIKFKHKSIAQVLEMDVQQALEHFENVPHVRHKLQTLHDVGLDYLKLGQPSPTLSGGEAQRIKLARELVKKSTGRTLYLLDEPTTGLHFADIDMLLKVLQGFVDAGNTVLVVEHNMDVIKAADWIVDLGPDGGAGGGWIVTEGSPEQVAKAKDSHTGKALAAALEIAKHGHAVRGDRRATARRNGETAAIERAVVVRGAAQHNLKHVDVTIPHGQMTVCCGPSGSGKTSLALDTVYAEGQRRYVESLSSYARQFVSQMPKPQFENITGLSPSVAIEQKNLAQTPRSTVGTVTEVYDYMRVLFARCGTPHCPECGEVIGTQSVDEIVDKVVALDAGTRIYIAAPIELRTSETYDSLWRGVKTAGYRRVRVDGKTHELDDAPKLDRRRKHRVEVIIDRATVRSDNRKRLADSIEQALELGHGTLHVVRTDEQTPETRWSTVIHSQHYACDACGRSFEPLSPHSFSFNSSLGWCPECEGLGTQIGAHPAALVNDGKLTLRQGALAVWPTARSPMTAAMLEALSAQSGVPLDVPYDDLTAEHRRIVLHGLDDEWIDVRLNAAAGANGSAREIADTPPSFRFQYKGVYPSLDEAARLSPSFRARLEHLVDEVECSICGGSRIREDAAAVRLFDRSIDYLCRTPLGDLLDQVSRWTFTAARHKVAVELVREIHDRLKFLVNVGLDYLTLGRTAPTLSGGEAQRIRLAAQLGSGLTGVLYVLDEPTIGLHPRDNRRLIDALVELRDLGNTLLVVEHDREVVMHADHLLDFGPGSGSGGGEIVARGTPAQLATRKGSVTGPYLSGRKAIPIPNNRRLASGGADGAMTGTNSQGAAATAPQPLRGRCVEIIGARHHNLNNIDVQIPLGALSVVTGVSGSGKSSLVHDVLFNAAARILHRAGTIPGSYDSLRGLEQINKVISVNQRPLGNTPTSNPATYTGVFEHIRELFSQLPESKLRGYAPRRFSFNVAGGRCDKCGGAGQLRIEMHFLPDVWIECDVCRGTRYNPETLAVRYRGKNIADVLAMSCRESLELFANIPKIRRTMETLCDVGLDYVRLGQPAPTLSGGEAQRVKLASELARPDTGRTLYVLDEPTTGLHFDDLAKLLEVLQRLVDLGNTVVVIEHNLDVIKSADWVIELGPEAGHDGGRLVAAGTPEDIVAHAALARKGSGTKSQPGLLRCHTGDALEAVLAAGPYEERRRFDANAATASREDDVEIAQIGLDTKMPWEIDGRRWHTKERVGRAGESCKWDGRVVDEVVDRIESANQACQTNWSNRSLVEITGPNKTSGWFLHALTGDAWLVTLKFHVPKKTFEQATLVKKLRLKSLNDMPDLPVYGTSPRVKCHAARGPWQEVQLKIYSWEEINRKPFWEFLDTAIEAYRRTSEAVAQNPEDLMPWRVLGRKWHASRKGFPPGRRVGWPAELLDQLCAVLEAAAPECEFDWQQQQVVHVTPPRRSATWASIHTKRATSIDLVLSGPAGRFAQGQITDLGHEPQHQSGSNGRDQIRIRFRSAEDLDRGDLGKFLRQHYAARIEQPLAETR
jgi:excinuclease ABC subunit A